MTWYAVRERWRDDSPERNAVLDERAIWTVSQSPDVCGWETDSGCGGYGLPRSVAQFLADAANEKEEKERMVE